MYRPGAKILGVGAALAVVSLSAWGIFHGGNQAHYRTAKVERGDIEATISATGNPNAVVTVQVGSQVSGNISQLMADFNTKVKKGQVVARIDPAIFEAKVNMTKGNVESARASVLNANAAIVRAQADVAASKANQQAAEENVAKAKAGLQDSSVRLKRRVDLANQAIISKEERDTAQTTNDLNLASVRTANAQVEAAKAAVRAAEAQLEVAKTLKASAQAQVKQYSAAQQQAQIDLDHTFIRAPVDGTVVSRKVDIGQTVAAGFQAPLLFEIAQDLKKMHVDTNVDEADVGRIEVGFPAMFTVDAYPGQEFHGEVVEIRKAPINVQNVITYDVLIDVSNEELKLFPGMTANVKILVDKRQNVLKIPNSALRFRPPDAKELKTAKADRKPKSGRGKKGAREKTTQTVWVLGEDGKPKPVKITLGITDGTYSEIVSGDMTEGEAVIVGTIGNEPSGSSGAASPFGGGSKTAAPSRKSGF